MWHARARLSMFCCVLRRRSGDAEIERGPLVDTIAGVALSMGTLVPLVALANSDADVVSKTGGVVDKNMHGVSLEVL